MKKELRKKLLNIRKELSKLEVSNYSKNIINKIKNSQEFKDAKVIGLYYPIKNEVDLLELLKENKAYCFPRVLGDEMDFYLVNSLDDFHLGAFNVLEPNFDLKKIEKNEMDIIYIPCVGMSNKGYRIGYGKGYYDKYLKNYQNRKIAVCYNFQIVDESFEEEFDVRVDEIISN